MHVEWLVMFRKYSLAFFAVFIFFSTPLSSAVFAQALTPCDADIVPDGVVNLLDYSQFSQHFFTADETSDINNDGVVNLIDYSILSSFFMDSCQPSSPTPSASPSPSPTATPVVTPTPTASPSPSTSALLITRDEIMAKPTSGSGWSNLVTYANRSNALPDFEASDDDFQSDETNVIYLAKAIVGVRTNDQAMIDKVEEGLQAIVDSNPDNYNFRALGLGRELGAYVIAADIIDLKNANPTLDVAFRQKLQLLRTIQVPGGPDTLIECSNERPNNWGTHCTASRMAVALYLNDQADFNQAVTVFRGWLGDRSAYAGFEYGELAWQCNQAQPVGINPKDCMISGHNVGGAQPEERRRSQITFGWPPVSNTDYDWEGLQGPYMTALLVERHGHPTVWQWSDQALNRAVAFNYNVLSLPAEGDDLWIPHIVNARYGTSYPTQAARPGKNFGFTDWLL
jgi:hypothetical protein